MDNGSPISEYELQVKLYKRAKMREIKTNIVFAIGLLFGSYIAAYTVLFLSTMLIGIIPVDHIPIVYSIIDALIYFAQMAVPIILYLILASKNPLSLFKIRGSDDDPNGYSRITFGGTLAYFVIAFSLSQIMATVSMFFSEFISYIGLFFSENLILDPAAFAEPVPMSIPEFMVSIISVAVLPAILEELLFRGAFLNMFLHYGKTFAIVMSAFLFASAHGSIDQMMYSFVYGIIFGYIAVKTGSLTTGIIIHFINNLYSCTADYLGYILDAELFETVIMTVNIILVAAGLAVVIYKTVKNKIGYSEKHDREKAPYELTNAETFRVFTCPVMLFYYAFIIFETLYIYISYNMKL